MRRTDLLPGTVVYVPPGACTDIGRGFRMRVKTFEISEWQRRPVVVQLSGQLLHADGSPHLHQQRAYTVHVGGVEMIKESPGPLCGATGCYRTAVAVMPQSGNAMYPLCADDLRPAEQAMQASGVWLADIDHTPTYETQQGQSILKCPCGWACWVGAEEDPAVERRWQVLSAGHAACGWSVRAVGDPFDGAVYEGTTASGDPCWLWNSPRTRTPQMVLWEARNPFVSTGTVHADGAMPQPAEPQRRWPVMLTARQAADADADEDLRRARSTALAYIGDWTGLTAVWVTPEGMHGPLPSADRE